MLLDRNSTDPLALARIEKRFSQPVAEIEVIARDASPVMICGIKRVPKTIADVLGVDRLDALQYRAYALVESLVANSISGKTNNCILSCYHEFSSIIFSLLSIHALLVSARASCIILVDTNLIELIRQKSEPLRDLSIDELELELDLGGQQSRFLAGLQSLLRRFSRVFNAALAELRASCLSYRKRTKHVYRAYRDIRRHTNAVRIPISYDGRRKLNQKGAFVGAFRRPRRFLDKFFMGFLRESHRRIQLRHLSLLSFCISAIAWLLSITLPGLVLITEIINVIIHIIVVFLSWLWSIIYGISANFRDMSYRGLTKWERMHEGLRRVDESLAPVRQLVAAEGGRNKNMVVLTVQDSGTRVNLDPAIAIAKELRTRQVLMIILTESHFVWTELAREGLDSILLPQDFPRNWFVRPAPQLPLNKLSGDHGVVCLINSSLRRFWRQFFIRYCDTQRVMTRIEAHIRIGAVLSINETLPVCVSAGLWARAAGRPWIGHFPILLGKRPDCYFFPADKHLLYGEQLRDQMSAAGVTADAMEVVGSFTYDKQRGRDQTADRRAVERRFPRAKNKKLVTVATENLPRCEIELTPVLKAVSSMPNVHVILKLHPEDSPDFFEDFIVRMGVRDTIDIVKKYPLSELLSASDLLVCVMSNIAVEAAVMGTPTLACDFSGKTKVLDFVAEGLCVGCRKPDDLPAMIKSLLFDESFAKVAHGRMAAGMRRFNGPNDGRSTERIVDYIVAQAGGRRRVSNVALSPTRASPG